MIKIAKAEDNSFLANSLINKLGLFADFKIKLHSLDGSDLVQKIALDANIDVILMDIRMPVMDGLEATRRIHALPECAEIPIVALTAGAGPEEQEQCRAAGCLGFLSKPLEMAALNSELKRHVRSPEGS